MRHVYDVPVVMPYRLDLTVSVLRRLSTNVIDVLTPEGQYMRALSASPGPVIVRATQIRHEASLSITVETTADKSIATRNIVCEMLGCNVDLTEFHAAASQIPWLAPLVKRMRGVKPPRYPSLWEACANAIVFQQVSLRAASSIMHRLIVMFGKAVECDGAHLYAFPTMESFRDADDALLRTAGLSGNKAAALRGVADAILSGALDAARLKQSPSPDAAMTLRSIKGIGPWTAAVILLRGLGRLDVFPANDTSIASNLAPVAGSAPVDAKSILEMLGDQRGMPCFYLLLARLEARDEIGRPSFKR